MIRTPEIGFNREEGALDDFVLRIRPIDQADEIAGATAPHWRRELHVHSQEILRHDLGGGVDRCHPSGWRRGDRREADGR